MTNASLDQIPIYLRSIPAKQEFMTWLFRQPIAWTDRRRIAKLWADLNGTKWTASEIFQMGARDPRAARDV